MFNAFLMSPDPKVTNAFSPSDVTLTLRCQYKILKRHCGSLEIVVDTLELLEYPWSMYSLLFLDDIFETRGHLFGTQGSKSKPCTSGLDCWNYLRQVVADDAETCVLRKFFNDYNETQRQFSFNDQRSTTNPTMSRRSIEICLQGSPLRNAFCASCVIASASSKMTNLNPDLVNDE